MRVPATRARLMDGAMCVGDLGIVVAVEREAGTARVSTGGTERTVSLAVRPDTRPGDRVVVHTGFVVEVVPGDDRPETDEDR